MPGLLAQIEALNSEITALQAQLTALQGQASAKDAEIAALAGQVGSLEGQLAGKDAAILALQEQLAGKNAEIAALQEQLAGQQVGGFAYLSVPPTQHVEGDNLSREGVYQLPPGVTTVFVEVWGGGGGGGNGNLFSPSAGGGHGGGGGYSRGFVVVQNPPYLPFKIGMGGTQGFGSSPMNGARGGTSSVGNIVAGGGTGGRGANDTDYCDGIHGEGGTGDFPGLPGGYESTNYPGISFVDGMVSGPGAGGVGPRCHSGSGTSATPGKMGLIRISW